MPGLGTIINVVLLVAGGLLGLAGGRFITPRIQDTLMKASGLCVLFIGLGGTMQKMLFIDGKALTTTGTTMLIVSFALGSLIGEAINLEAAIENLGEWLKRKTGSEGDNEFTNAFVSTSLTVCIGAMAIVGSIQDGLLGDWSTLALKGALDCIIVCTMTALVVLCTGVWTEGGTGAALTATAFGAGFGNAIAGTVFVVAIITFFAFTTALVNVYYGEICMTVLGGKKFILPYRLLGCAFAIIGSVGALSVLWNLFDFFFGVCAVCNLVVCFLMRKQIGALINDYLTRLKSGKWEPTSEAAANAIPELWVNDKAAK